MAEIPGRTESVIHHTYSSVPEHFFFSAGLVNQEENYSDAHLKCLAQRLLMTWYHAI